MAEGIIPLSHWDTSRPSSTSYSKIQMLATMTNDDLLLFSHPLEMNTQSFGETVFYPDLQMLFHQNILIPVTEDPSGFSFLTHATRFFRCIDFLTEYSFGLFITFTLCQLLPVIIHEFL